MQITDFHAKYFAAILCYAAHGNTPEALTGTLPDAKVDINPPRQVDATLFTIRAPFSKGAIMEDEVGPDKIIEAIIVMAQLWAEERRRMLVIWTARYLI